MAITDTERALLVAGVAAAATLTVALSAYVAAKRDRRRKLYGEAMRAALSWREMLYRVRRRTKDSEADLVSKFHELQENLTFYQGWIGSESKYLARSYGRLIAAVKRGTEDEIRRAWSEPIRNVPGDAKPSDTHPSFDNEASMFLRDVRAYLSLWPWRKLAVYFRNRRP